MTFLLGSGLFVLLILLAVGLSYKEDISDFLPDDEEYRESMQVQQQLQEASRIVVIFEGNDADSLCEAVDDYADRLEQAFHEQAEAGEMPIFEPDRLITSLDMDGYLSRLRFVHSHAPFFLTDSDYIRLNSLICPDSIRAAIARDRELLSMPGTGILRDAIAGDPLSIFPLSVGASGQYAAASQSFTSYDGYMMTANRQMAFAFYDTPFGSTESYRNGFLIDGLCEVATTVMADFLSVHVRLLGAPVISVGNARRIKRDSLMAIILSLILITALLLYAFPRKRDILLILLSVGFGWLVGMATLRLCVGEVSAIVLGIGSVLIGIAVNYPLHLLVHQRYTTSVRQTLQEVISPLVVGNITTVGAFLALVPLRAVALRDLGIFASSMLLGTILFCVLFLPHLMSDQPTAVREIHLPKRLFSSFLGSSKSHFSMGYLVLFILTGIFAVVPLLSDMPLFDSNLSHINYMTPQQRADFAWFESLDGKSDQPAFLASSAREELSARLVRWEEWRGQTDIDSLITLLHEEAEQQGFRPDAFAPFEQMLQAPISQEKLTTADLAQLWPGRFDSAALNSRVADALSSNFDYLGLVCSCIVFLFLWISFRRFSLALIAFLPMAISWVWIVGIMHLIGLQFNIVNMILATFIFGQGDDYTIFVLEGLIYEYKTGKPMLPQYRQSIILSAIIMLLGIGVLIIAAHPAMYSLGAVTLIGMACVVLMACCVPPFFFRLCLNIPWLKRRIS